MVDTGWTWSLQERIPSSLAIAHLRLEKLLGALRESGWDGRDYFHVQMASEEALVNAVTHGNKESLDKFVEIDFRVAVDRVRLRIKDEGLGFNPANIPDPTSDERREVVHGRGVWLIRQMMSEVTYLGCGNELVMIRYRNDPQLAELDEDDDDDIFTQD